MITWKRLRLPATALAILVVAAASSSSAGRHPAAPPPAPTAFVVSADSGAAPSPPTPSAVLCRELFGESSDSHGELGQCLALAPRR